MGRVSCMEHSEVLSEDTPSMHFTKSFLFLFIRLVPPLLVVLLLKTLTFPLFELFGTNLMPWDAYILGDMVLENIHHGRRGTGMRLAVLEEYLTHFLILTSLFLEVSLHSIDHATFTVRLRLLPVSHFIPVELESRLIVGG